MGLTLEMSALESLTVTKLQVPVISILLIKPNFTCNLSHLCLSSDLVTVSVFTKVQKTLEKRFMVLK